MYPLKDCDKKENNIRIIKKDTPSIAEQLNTSLNTRDYSQRQSIFHIPKHETRSQQQDRFQQIKIKHLYGSFMYTVDS